MFGDLAEPEHNPGSVPEGYNSQVANGEQHMRELEDFLENLLRCYGEFKHKEG
jgi:hypothetical protein